MPNTDAVINGELRNKRCDTERIGMRDKEKVAQWMVERGFVTGHGDTIEDLLKEIEWQVKEREREACAKLCEGWTHADGDKCAEAIRARG